MGKSKCAKSPISYLTTVPPEFETSKLLLKAVALAYRTIDIASSRSPSRHIYVEPQLQKAYRTQCKNEVDISIYFHFVIFFVSYLPYLALLGVPSTPLSGHKML